MRRTCALLLCTLGFYAESSRVATPIYVPRSQTLDGLRQQRLSKTIDGQIKKFKAIAGAPHESNGFHDKFRAHPKRSNKTNASNPFVHNMQELLNGTAMANISVSSPGSPALYHMTSAEERRLADTKRHLFGKEKKKKEEKHVEHVQNPTNGSELPGSKHVVAPSTKPVTLSSSLHDMDAMMNATAKELKLNLSRPAANMTMPPKPKSPSHDEIQKVQKKAFGDSSGAWKRESQAEQIKNMAGEVRKEVAQLKNSSTPSRQSLLNSTVGDVVKMDRDVQEAMDSFNASKTNKTNATAHITVAKATRNITVAKATQNTTVSNTKVSNTKGKSAQKVMNASNTSKKMQTNHTSHKNQTNTTTQNLRSIKS